MENLRPQVHAVQWKDGACVLLDQTKLPGEEIYLRCTEYEPVVEAIRVLAVRGAPAIGIAAAYAVVLAARTALQSDWSAPQLQAALDTIRHARPTAVNLSWAVQEMARVWARHEQQLSEAVVSDLEKRAEEIHRADIEANAAMARAGAKHLPPGNVLTICNTGDLATGGIGTALGVIREAHRQQRIAHVYACETRPVLQGLRLTAWELEKARIPFTVLCDSMAAHVMREKRVQSVIVGADRIAANGDVANKVGTYSLAVLARYHKIPFFVAAPWSTFDLATPGAHAIPIEQRAGHEVLDVLKLKHPNPPSFPVLNPSFDVTPFELINGLVCERGVLLHPMTPEAFHRGGSA